MRSALSPNLTSISTSDEDSLDLSAYRNVFDLPGGPASLGLGMQYRVEDNNNPSLNPDNAAQGLGNTFDVRLQQHRLGVRRVGSARLPAFRRGSSRRASTTIRTSATPSIPRPASKYSPFPWITIRGTASSGFRAPGFAENGNAQTSAFVTTTAANIAPDSFAAAHGNDAYVSNPYALNVINSAFAGIKPETSASYTGGFIVNPLENIAITTDYYYIEKWNLIQPPSIGEASGLTISAGSHRLPASPSYLTQPDPDAPAAQPRPATVSGALLQLRSP